MRVCRYEEIFLVKKVESDDLGITIHTFDDDTPRIRLNIKKGPHQAHFMYQLLKTGYADVSNIDSE